MRSPKKPPKRMAFLHLFFDEKIMKKSEKRLDRTETLCYNNAVV